MSSKYFPLLSFYKILLISVCPIFLFSFDPAGFSIAAELNGLNEVTPEERDLYNTLPGEAQKGGILDATNPMELINRLRRATAMDDATSPSDAVDEALKALEGKSFE